MDRIEHDTLSEIQRVVDVYHSIIRSSDAYDGTGEIEFAKSPDDTNEFIDNVLTAMQRNVLRLREEGRNDLADAIQACVTQINDRRTDT